MSLSDQIIRDLKEAMKSGDRARTETVRMLKAHIKNLEIEKQRALTEEDEIQLLNSEVKKRKESMEMFQKGGRQDLYDQEAHELEIIQTYLPQPLSPEELSRALDQVLSELQASSSNDLGRVMKEMLSHYRGRVDGKQVQELVRKKLT